MPMKTLQILACIACVSFNMMIGSAQPLTLEQVNGNTYLMNLQGKLEQNELTWSTYPDSWKDPIIIEMKKNQDTIKLNSVHPLIHLHTQGESYYFSQRLISLKGGINFRDLGGYVTRDGKQVKWGKIYRSADISKLTDDDLNVISTLHIVLDCDLRGDQEVAAGPDKIPTGVERLYLPAGSENMGMSDYLKYMKTETTADSIMMVFYSKTDHFQKKYKPVFDRLLILGNDEAVLF